MERVNIESSAHHRNQGRIEEVEEERIEKVKELCAIFNTKVEDWTADNIPEGVEISRKHLGDLVDYIAKTEQPLLEELFAMVEDDQGVERVAFKICNAGREGVPTVWLLPWRNGEKTQLHDHALSEAAVRVWKGTIAEDIYYLPPDYKEASMVEGGFQARVVTREVREGSTFTITSPYVHVVRNQQEEVAATIHAYYPPLGKMNYYKLDEETNNIKFVGEWNDED